MLGLIPKSLPKVDLHMNSQQQKAYDEMIAAGESHNIAEMLALQELPGLQTDKRFLHGKRENGFYSGQLQRWVSSKSDVKRICAEKNWDCEGSVSHKSYWDKPRDDEVPYQVADDIVDDAVFSTLVDNPTALKDDPELIEKTRTRLKGDL
jgi:hypothetical protein